MNAINNISRKHIVAAAGTSAVLGAGCMSPLPGEAPQTPGTRPTATPMAAQYPGAMAACESYIRRRSDDFGIPSDPEAFRADTKHFIANAKDALQTAMEDNPPAGDLVHALRMAIQEAEADVRNEVGRFDWRGRVGEACLELGWTPD